MRGLRCCHLLETAEKRVLVEGGTFARYVPPGHLVYARAGGLLAVPFDLKRLEVTGPPVSVLEGVSMNPSSGAAEFSSSTDGLLAYVPGGSSLGEGTLLWVDRKGAAQALPAPPRAYVSARLSPDGQRLAVGIQGGGKGGGTWLYELARGTLTRLSETATATPFPIWSPDGKHVVFRSMASGGFNLYRMPADGSGVAERLTTSENLVVPGSWSPNGRVFAFSEQDMTTGWDIWVQSLKGEQKPQPFLQTPANEFGQCSQPTATGWRINPTYRADRRYTCARFPTPAGRCRFRPRAAHSRCGHGTGGSCTTATATK